MWAVVLLLCLGAASGEEVPVEEIETIIVYGDLEVETARIELINKLRDNGFTIERRRDNYLLLRHQVPWKGQVKVYDDGWVMVGRQPVRVEAPQTRFAERNSPLAWAGCLLYPHRCISLNGILISEAKFEPIESRAVAMIKPEVDRLSGAISAVATNKKRNELAGQLQSLWELGEPLSGEEIIDSYLERKIALLRYWDSRTETEWGDDMRAGVEAFIRAVVQHSDHPITQKELEQFAVLKRCNRGIDLGRGVSLPSSVSEQ